MPRLAHDTTRWDALAGDRAHVLHVLTGLTGDREIAEDLTQETLIEAWRHAHKLTDASARLPWLSAIARNVYRRWLRRCGRQAAQQMDPLAWEDVDALGVEELLREGDDLAVALERDELADLLDRALALLPPATREALVARYVQESPLAEIAARLRMSEKAVSMRLSRGKLLLHRVLITDFKDDAIAYGLCGDAADNWQQTRIWCSVCGQRRLRGLRTEDALTLSCPACHQQPGMIFLHTTITPLISGVRGFKPALNRLMAWAYDYFTDGLRAGAVACLRCGSPCSIRLDSPSHPASNLPVTPRYSCQCEACGQRLEHSLAGLAAAHPASRRFWRQHPRIRTLPSREIEASGRPALVFGVESVTGGARLDLVAARDTFEVLGIHGVPDA